MMLVDTERGLGSERACADAGASVNRSEIDPDVFGNELDQPQYDQVERIAAISAIIRRRG